MNEQLEVGASSPQSTHVISVLKTPPQTPTIALLRTLPLVRAHGHVTVRVSLELSEASPWASVDSYTNTDSI